MGLCCSEISSNHGILGFNTMTSDIMAANSSINRLMNIVEKLAVVNGNLTNGYYI